MTADPVLHALVDLVQALEQQNIILLNCPAYENAYRVIRERAGMQPEGGALNDALELLRICREDCDLHYGNGEGARVGAFDTVAARVDDFLKRCTPQSERE